MSIFFYLVGDVFMPLKIRMLLVSQMSLPSFFFFFNIVVYRIVKQQRTQKMDFPVPGYSPHGFPPNNLLFWLQF